MVKSIVILGASFNTGNLGVSALAASSIKLIDTRFAECKISILGGQSYNKKRVLINNKYIDINCYPVRYSPNLFKKNHIFWLFITIYLFKVIPFIKLSKTNTAYTILNSDMICDITGGDSFSDIYGMKRFIMGYLLKSLCQFSGKPFIMLPQTYGPFTSNKAKLMARKILQKSDKIYSRDKEGLEVVENTIGKTNNAKLCPDIAFTLSSCKCDLPIGFPIKAEIIIGLNVSGLLYNGGYTGKNDFGLKCDYNLIINNIIEYFTAMNNVYVMLVPHVVPENNIIENDLLSCKELLMNLPEKQKSKTFIAESKTNTFYDQCEIKYIIGHCNFFLGSRMHSTIAAISQCIPTVGLAYSKKFKGVYDSADIEDCVVDMRELSTNEILVIIKSIFDNRFQIKEKLNHKIPEIVTEINSVFDNIFTIH